jgi:putative FmdB family regulatory protein
MPTYEMKCDDCGYTGEFTCAYNKRPSKCTECGGKLKQVLHPPAIAFKGAGFHCNDYK